MQHRVPWVTREAGRPCWDGAAPSGLHSLGADDPDVVQVASGRPQGDGLGGEAPAAAGRGVRVRVRVRVRRCVCVCVRACMRVCKRERERERERVCVCVCGGGVTRTHSHVDSCMRARARACHAWTANTCVSRNIAAVASQRALVVPIRTTDDRRDRQCRLDAPLTTTLVTLPCVRRTKSLQVHRCPSPRHKRPTPAPLFPAVPPPAAPAPCRTALHLPRGVPAAPTCC
jgi:hypothetical protein